MPPRRNPRDRVDLHVIARVESQDDPRENPSSWSNPLIREPTSEKPAKAGDPREVVVAHAAVRLNWSLNLNVASPNAANCSVVGQV
jgi:hypothetical protein